jgi:hypothetical protein
VAEYTPGFVQRSHLETGTRGPDRPLINARASRNCLRLMAKYPDIAEALKLTVVSFYMG